MKPTEFSNFFVIQGGWRKVSNEQIGRSVGCHQSFWGHHSENSWSYFQTWYQESSPQIASQVRYRCNWWLMGLCFTENDSKNNKVGNWAIRYFFKTHQSSNQLRNIRQHFSNRHSTLKRLTALNKILLWVSFLIIIFL